VELTDYLRAKALEIERALDSYLPPESHFPVLIYQSMRYSIYAGGKRIRPILALAATEAVGGNIAQTMPVACALEMIHTYSLIHDDLPGMDNDDYRRGKLTNHKVYGEGIAILAGCALLTHAFQIINRECRNQGVDPETILRVLEEVAAAAGVEGMIGGQVVDLQSEGIEIPLETLDYIHAHKTGALLTCSLRVGGIMGGALPEELNSLTFYAQKIGLAFQIVDDILDLTGVEKKLGKKVGSDLAKEKATYPSFYGLEESRKMARQLIEEAKKEILFWGERGKVLTQLADYIVERDF